MKTADAKKLCFSYVRYSSGKQHGNTSEARQLEIAPRVAAEKGWRLESSFNAADLGYSGWTGSNVKTIESIISAANSGSIPRGTVCILEALDRLTRLQLDDAYQLFRRLLKSGIEIYTERSGRHLTEADLNNPMSVMMTVVELDAAFQFSDKLSERVSTAWRKKREAMANGVKLTNMVPGWIEANTWKPISERVAVVRRIYKLYLDGYGISLIVRKLNQDGVPTWSKSGKKTDWSSSHVSEILKSKAVIGEFQAFKCIKAPNGRYYKRIPTGDVVKGYFPPIIKEEVYYTVQSKLGNKKKTRNTESHRNLFSGVAYCTCGGRMFLAGAKRGFYYTCWNKLKGKKCKQPSMRYEPIESAFASIFWFLPELIGKNQEDGSNQAEVLRSKIAEAQKQVVNITNAVKGGVATKALVAAQDELEKDIEALESELKIAEAKSSSGNLDAADLRYITTALATSTLQDDMELRRRVRNWCISKLHSIVFNGKTKKCVVKARADVEGLELNCSGAGPVMKF